MTILEFLFRAVVAIWCIISIPAALIGFLCCHNPDLPGFKCDHPGVAALMVLYIALAIASLAFVFSPKTKKS